MKKLVGLFLILGWSVFAQTGEAVRLRTISSRTGTEAGVAFHLVKIKVTFPPSIVEHSIEVRLNGEETTRPLAARRTLVRARALVQARALWTTLRQPRAINPDTSDYVGIIDTTLP